MSPDTSRLFDQLMDLPPATRRALAQRVLNATPDADEQDDATLEAADQKEPGYDEAWSAEIDRRLREIDEGKVEMIPWEQVKANIRRIIDEPGA